ncbi:MAG: C2H2-type zinc finger protein [Candidatus Babeliales bacterium]
MKTLTTKSILLLLISAAEMSSAMEEMKETEIPIFDQARVERTKRKREEDDKDYTPKDKITYACHHLGCGKIFGKKYNLDRHIRNHNGEKLFKCECGKKFAQWAGLTRHKKIHTICRSCLKKPKHCLCKDTCRINKPIERISCPYCSSTFARKNAYVTHMKDKHAPNINTQQSATIQQESLAPAESLTPAPTSLVPTDLGYQPLAPDAALKLSEQLTLALDE